MMSSHFLEFPVVSFFLFPKQPRADGVLKAFLEGIRAGFSQPKIGWFFAERDAQEI